MARTVRDSSLETRTARVRLKPRGKPYYRALEPGLHLGYRRPLTGAGKWVARHYVGNETYEVETLATADDFSDADGIAILNYRQAQAAARERMVARTHHAAGKAGPFTVRDAVESYLEFLDSHRKTGYGGRRRAEAFIIPALGHIEVAALTTEQIRKWHIGLAKTPPRARTALGAKQQYREIDHTPEGQRRRKATANKILAILRAALNHAWREGRAPTDAAWRRVRPFERADTPRLRYLSVEECKRLVNASDPDFRRLVQAAIATGCRYGELCRATVADFNAAAGTLTIRISKTGSQRHIVLADEAQPLFEEWCAGRAGDELLFVRADGKPWGTSHQQLPMLRACERAGITPPACFHILRHSHASHLVMGGAPLSTVAKQLGHSNTRITEQVYSHLSPDYVADAIRAATPKFGLKPDRRIVRLR